jgi:Zn-dependent alcohol dehydrogenase
MNSAQIKPGETVAVIGTGGVGGAAIIEIFAVDLNEEKLALAHQLGATRLVNTARTDLARTMAQGAGGKGGERRRSRD